LAGQRKNIHILETDISEPKKLDATAEEIAKITGGSLDVLVLNAGSASTETSAWGPAAL
jgi:NAD(P)-dependent dehydrogenase (short-subunit alcohol dehydrogenase family)